MKLDFPLAEDVRTGFNHLEVAEKFGASLVQLSGMHDGKTFYLFPELDPVTIQKEISENPNRIFRVWGAPLFPLANRLRDPSKEASSAESGNARLLGVDISFPLNHGGGDSGTRAHHLHGTLYSRGATTTTRSREMDGATLSSHFAPLPNAGWAEDVLVTTNHRLIAGKYRYELRAENRSENAVPVGFGAHPYFELPGHEPADAELFIPADKVGIIDNFQNVFPTGEWQLTKASRFDFTASRKLPEGRFDHFFLFRAEEPKIIELRDLRFRIGFRMKALSENIMGAQFYYPGHGSIFALEMVTHLPDPRTEIWGDQNTGMRLIHPGESVLYAFEIEAFPL